MGSENRSISVIIPCFNCSKYLDRTLTSLENQDFKDFVVVCINDGSTDNTLDILERWKEKGTLRIKIINQENGGVSKARNAGIRACNTKYIAFCDSDDEYGSSFLSSLYNAIEADAADAAYCYLTKDQKKIAQ